MEVSFPPSVKQAHCCFQLLNYSYRTDCVGHASYTPKHSTFSFPPESVRIFWDTDTDKLAGFKGVTIGVCAMNSKSTSQPMQQILTRMVIYDFIRVIVVCDDTILNKPVERWPHCDAFLAFYSKGFPLEKAIKYVELRKPKLIINDLEMQYKLQDRRQVYKILSENGIDVPPHMIFNRSSVHGRELVETDDSVEVNGVVFHKPFVEKPLSAEDHNIYIYFPSAYGGGSQRLFRKIKDRSSSYSQESEVRKEGSYIYEEFLATDGTDVKVYTVGVDYAHAEARKSPALDGRVERNMQGKEQRYPVILNAAEKLIARKVCLAFKQTVCGFDLLRSNGKCYVCDVNGFSFVKSSQKYFDDCAQILLQTILEKVEPGYFPLEAPSLEYLAPEAPVPILDPSKTSLELRCVIGVIRHGDRTPKQKMKMVVKHADFFRLFRELGGYKQGYLKIKKPKELQKILDIARKLLENVEKDEEYEIEEKVNKLQQLKTVLEMYGHFSGINRKVQFKTLHKRMDGSLYAEPALLLILKWGGELTPAGQRQAEDLGHVFRLMYPGGEGEYAMLPGSGFIRLHSTYRHDLKVYASDEGRVQMTAAAFTKGLLDLEGELASILVHLVKRDENATAMLDTSTDSNCALQKVKQRLHLYMQSTSDFSGESIHELNPTNSTSISTSLRSVKNPHRYCQKVYETIDALLVELEEIHRKHPRIRLYHGETMEMMINRWSKLFKDFKLKNGRFDISKIPDIYDCIKYDLLHNSALHLKNSRPLFVAAMHLADIVIPQEYGISLEEKVDISRRICRSLFRKIRADLRHTLSNEESDVLHRLDASKSQGVVSPNRHVRTRLYFTSESLIHSLFNVLRYGPLKEKSSDAEQFEKVKEQLSAFPELNYMAQVVLMVFEDLSQPSDSPNRHIVQVHVSPGVKSREQLLNRPQRGDRRDTQQASAGAQFGSVRRITESVRRITGPVRRISDHVGLMFRQPSLPTTKMPFRPTSLQTSGSASTVGCNTCLSAAVTTTSSHVTSSVVQNTSSKMLPTCSGDCLESDSAFSNSFLSVKKPCNSRQRRSPIGSDRSVSPTVGSDASGCTLVSQEEENSCIFSVHGRGGHDERGGSVDEWIMDECTMGELKSYENDDRPRSRSGLRSSSEGDMSLISESSNDDREGLPLSSSSAINIIGNHNLQLRSSSLEALSIENDYNETPASLESVINPLIFFCSLPLQDVDDFLTEMSQELTPLD